MEEDMLRGASKKAKQVGRRADRTPSSDALARPSKEQHAKQRRADRGPTSKKRPRKDSDDDDDADLSSGDEEKEYKRKLTRTRRLKRRLKRERMSKLESEGKAIDLQRPPATSLPEGETSLASSSKDGEHDAGDDDTHFGKRKRGNGERKHESNRERKPNVRKPSTKWVPPKLSKEEATKFLYAKQYFRRQYVPNSTEAPLLSVMDTLLTQEQSAAAAISLLALDGRQDNETYRWPLREDLIPIVPKISSVHFPAEPDAFEQQGMGFVDELAGVPKKEEDYSDSDTDMNQDSSDDAENGDSADEARQELLLKQRRLAKQRRARHANERLANSRLEQVHSLLNSEFLAFAHKQYRKGTKERIQDLDAFQRETLPPFRIRAARASIGRSKGGDEQEDEMTPIQEKAVSFAAEDSLRRVLDRLPYVIRQGALGELPDYVKLGLPKPVTSVADYERNWDTVMAAASISGVDDRILKKVGVRMKELLSISEQSRYYETPPRTSLATGEDFDETESESDGSEAEDRVQIKSPLAQASAKEVWRGAPIPLHLAREFVDALDPKFSVESRVRNAQKRREWLCKDATAGVVHIDTE